MRLITKISQLGAAVVLAAGITAFAVPAAQAGPHNGNNVAALLAGEALHAAIDNNRRHGFRRSYRRGHHSFRRNFFGRHGFRRNYRRGHHSNRRSYFGRHAFRRNFGGHRSYRRHGGGHY